MSSILLSDADIASKLSMSPSWVRNERFKRRHGQHHTLTIDPINIGAAVRYRSADVNQWLESLGMEKVGA